MRLPGPLSRPLAVTTFVAATLLPAPSGAQTGRSDDREDALAAVLRGGVTVVCRHAATGSFREREPVDYDDPTTQRRLSPEGEEQARRMGRAIRAAGIGVAEVVASPMSRARRTAELMFARPVVVDRAWHTNGGDYRGPGLERRRAVLATPVPGDPGGNRFVVSHIGTMRSVLPGLRRRSVDEGDCAVVRPGAGSFELVGVVPWRAWARHASSRGSTPGTYPASSYR